MAWTEETAAAISAGRPVAITSDAEEQTASLARALAAILPRGTVIALSGTLGAGKTAFVRGLAEGLGRAPGAPVPSPTYALVHTLELPDDEVLVHADLYRLGDDPDELEALGFRDWLDTSRCVAIEWAEQCPEAFGAAHLAVQIADEGPTRRTIRVAPGPRHAFMF